MGTLTHPRARILEAACELLLSGGRGAVTTRAVSTAAAVQPQTIYRHFGDMQGLLDEVTHDGFRGYLASKSGRVRRADPVDDLRDGWDLHVEFALANPALYVLMYGEADTKRHSQAKAEATAILRGLIEAVARGGRLRVEVDRATALSQATGVGVSLTLIAAEPDERDLALSALAREAVIAAITLPASDAATADSSEGLPAVAIALRAAMADADADADADAGLTPGESLLLTELLARLSRSGSPGT